MGDPPDEPPGETPRWTRPGCSGGLFPCWEASFEDHINAINEEVKVIVAMDSGAVKNVIHPRQLPLDAEPTPPEDPDDHFVGANNSRIDEYGKCETVLHGKHGAIGCDWTLADVSRALHSVSTVCGPAGSVGKRDVLFNNNVCVVVPPGIVDAILKLVTPVVEYQRNGNLYTASMTMSSFHRQGQKA